MEKKKNKFKWGNIIAIMFLILSLTVVIHDTVIVCVTISRWTLWGAATFIISIGVLNFTLNYLDEQYKKVPPQAKR